MEQPYVYDPIFKRHIPVEFTFDGKICRYFILKDDLSKEGASYLSILNDLRECEKSINLLKLLLNDQKIDTLIKSALYTSSVTLYIRCFNKSWGRSARLKPEIFDNETAKLKTFHNEMDTMRDQYLGHAGTSKHETITMLLYFDPITEQIITSKASINRHQFGHDLDTFLQVIEIAKKSAEDCFKELKPRLEEYIHTQDHHRLFRKAKIPKEKDFM